MTRRALTPRWRTALGSGLLALCASIATGQDNRVRILAVGDTGDPGGSGEVAEGMLARARAGAPQAVLLLGDNVYPRGLSTDDWQEQLAAVMAPFRPLIELVTPGRVHAVTGNHDYYESMLFGFPVGYSSLGNERAQAQTDLWRYHFRWTDDTILRSPDGSVGVQVVFLDSARPVGVGPEFATEVFDQLRDLLARHRDDRLVQWRIVAAHHPLETLGEHGNFGKPPGFFRGIRTSVTGGQDTTAKKYRTYRQRVVKAIQDSGARVDAFLAGHDHSLQILDRPVAGCAPCPRTHVVSGAGSKSTPVAGSEGADYTTVGAGLPSEGPRGFVELEASLTGLRFRFYTGATPRPVPMGTTLESCAFALGPSPAALTAERCAP